MKGFDFFGGQDRGNGHFLTDAEQLHVQYMSALIDPPIFKSKSAVNANPSFDCRMSNPKDFKGEYIYI